MSRYKLLYFDVRGRAEVSRMIFAAAGQEYEDKRIKRFVVDPDLSDKPFTERKWVEQQKTEEWSEIQANSPFGQVPLLEVDGHTIGQAKVIAGFLAKRFGLAGKTEFDEAKAAMICETAEEAFLTLTWKINWEYAHDQDKEKREKEITKYKTEVFPKYLANFEKQVGEKGHFVADQLTYADIAFYEYSGNLYHIEAEIPYEKYPKLKAVVDNVVNNPGIAKMAEGETAGNFLKGQPFRRNCVTRQKCYTADCIHKLDKRSLNNKSLDNR